MLSLECGHGIGAYGRRAGNISIRCTCILGALLVAQSAINLSVLDSQCRPRQQPVVRSPDLLRSLDGREVFFKPGLRLDVAHGPVGARLS